VQLDYNLPKRFELEYIGKDNHPHRPVMIHRAPFGSMERFLRHPDRAFRRGVPALAAPEQVRVLPISEKFTDYGRKVEAELKAAGFRSPATYRPEKIGAKIREAQLEKVPYMLWSAKRRSPPDGAVRDRVDGDLGAMPVAELVTRLEKEVRRQDDPPDEHGDRGPGTRAGRSMGSRGRPWETVRWIMSEFKNAIRVARTEA